ncbi:MAG: hypothetical protein WB424_18730, partial [Terracidiphilus sp.]
MSYRYLLFVFGAASMAVAQAAPSVPVAPKTQSAALRVPVIRFEEASGKAGVNFTHSFGSAKLGSLLEGTGAGCIWFDYD